MPAPGSRSSWAEVGFADARRKLVAPLLGPDREQVVFWDLTRPEQPPVRFDERGGISGLSVSPDGRWVSVSSWSGIVALYDAATMARAAVLQGTMQGTASVTFSPDSRSLAVGGGGREAVRLWHVATQQELLTLPGKGQHGNKSPLPSSLRNCGNGSTRSGPSLSSTGPV